MSINGSNTKTNRTPGLFPSNDRMWLTHTMRREMLILYDKNIVDKYSKWCRSRTIRSMFSYLGYDCMIRQEGTDYIACIRVKQDDPVFPLIVRNEDKNGIPHRFGAKETEVLISAMSICNDAIIVLSQKWHSQDNSDKYCDLDSYDVYRNAAGLTEFSSLQRRTKILLTNDDFDKMFDVHNEDREAIIRNKALLCIRYVAECSKLIGMCAMMSRIFTVKHYHPIKPLTICSCLLGKENIRNKMFDFELENRFMSLLSERPASGENIGNLDDEDMKDIEKTIDLWESTGIVSDAFVFSVHGEGLSRLIGGEGFNIEYLPDLAEATGISGELAKTRISIGNRFHKLYLDPF